jgi:hypothetical protein
MQFSVYDMGVYLFTNIPMTKTFTTQEAQDIATQLGIDRNAVGFTLDAFTAGMNVELEHGARDPQTDVTHDDALTTGKIARAHLKEFPNYYTLLDEMEKQAKGK